MLLVWMFAVVVGSRGSRLRGLRQALLLSFAGFAGLIGYIIYMNINENLGGYYLGSRPADRELFPPSPARSDAPARDYLIYLPGAIRGKRYTTDIVHTETAAVVPHGYDAAIRRFAARLRPQDRLHIVGFSRGGGEALALAYDIRRPIASLVLADPTGDLLQTVEYRLNHCGKPRGVEYFKVYTVNSYDADTAANESIRKYVFFMLAKLIDQNYVETLGTNDHGMRVTGYRIDESDPGEVEKLRRRVVADHDRYVSGNKELRNAADKAKKTAL